MYVYNIKFHELQKLLRLQCNEYVSMSMRIRLLYYCRFAFCDHTCIVDCSSATLDTNYYVLTIPTPTVATEGKTANVTCVTNYEWSTSPYTGTRTATCTKVGGVATWVISNGDTCVG